MGKGKGKGSDFERQMCKRLSLWWSSDERDDIFWRAQGSGGRGTRRARAGLATHGQHGDVAATHPSGDAFVSFLTLELKCGYTTQPVIDVCDRPSRGGVKYQQTWDLFFCQVLESHAAAGTYAWAVCSRRNNRVAWLYMPRYLLTTLRGVGAMAARPRPYMAFTADVRLAGGAPGPWLDVVGVPLDHFLANTYPIHIKKLIRQRQQGLLCPPGKRMKTS